MTVAFLLFPELFLYSRYLIYIILQSYSYIKKIQLPCLLIWCQPIHFIHILQQKSRLRFLSIYTLKNPPRG